MYADVEAAAKVLWSAAGKVLHDAVGYSIEQTSDGGFIFAGIIEVNGWAIYDAWLVKIDANGANSKPIELLSSPLTAMWIAELCGSSPSGFS